MVPKAGPEAKNAARGEDKRLPTNRRATTHNPAARLRPQVTPAPAEGDSAVRGSSTDSPLRRVRAYM